MSAPRLRGLLSIRLVVVHLLGMLFVLVMPRHAAAQAPGGFVESALTSVTRPILSGASVGLPARGPFTFPAPYSTQGIRLTTPSDCGGSDCVRPVGYSYWRNMNNHVGSAEILVFLSLNPNAGGTGPTLFSYNKSTGATTNRGPLFSASSPFYWASGEGWYFSATMRNALYINDGPRLLRYDVIARTSTTVVDITRFAGANRAIWQVHSSSDDAVHSFTVKETSGYSDLGCGVYLERLDQYKFYPRRGTYDECQIDRSGRFLVIKQNADGRNAEDNVVEDLTTGAEWILADEAGALGHSDLGFGYGIGEDNWNNAPGAIRLWQYGGGITNGQLVYQATSWDGGSTHVSHTDARSDVPISQNVACNSNVNRSIVPHSNEIVCYRLDGSMQVLVVAPVMTNLNASGGGDDYGKSPKGNLDVTGEYFLWSSNMGTSRIDVFMVRIPLAKLGVGPNTSSAGTGSTGAGGGSTSSAFTLTLTRPTGGTILGPDIWCGDEGAACQVTKPAGQAMWLMALPTGTNTLASWGGCSANFVLSANTTCAPTFASAGGSAGGSTGAGGGSTSSAFTLSITRPSGGTILGPDIWCGDAGTICQVTKPAGTPITLIALPTAPHVLSSWGGCSANFTLTGNLNCEPSFSGGASGGTSVVTNTGSTSSYTLALISSGQEGGGGGYILGPEMFCAPGGGSLCSRTFNGGTAVTLTPVPYSGFAFGGWVEAGCGNTMTMNASKTCTANFNRIR